MAQYKFSSQFTDLVTARSKNPDEVLSEVGNALSQLGDIGNLSSDDSQAAGAFHETLPSISDQDLMNTMTGTPAEKARFVNHLYGLLNRVPGTGVSKRTRDYIELFLEGKVGRTGKKVGPVFNPVPVPSAGGGGGGGGQPGPAGVIRRRERKPEQSVGPVVPPPSASPRFERDEDMMISRLDRKREREKRTNASNVLDLFVKAGILEKVPGIDERMVRMNLRKKAWSKMLAIVYDV